MTLPVAAAAAAGIAAAIKKQSDNKVNSRRMS